MSRVDQDEAAIRHRVAADFDYLPIRAGSFEAQFLVSVFEAAAEFRVDATGIKFAPLRQDTEVFSIARTLSQKSFGKVEQSAGNYDSTRPIAGRSSNIATPSAMLSKVTRNSA